MSASHDDERPEGAPPKIPGAWLKPAAAFADESHVVRPDRRHDEVDRAKLVRLSLLAVAALGVAVFSWRVTVSLKDAEDESQRPSYASAAPRSPAPPAPKARPKPVDVAEALPGEALRAEVGEAREDDPGEPEAPEILVPPPDPSFPKLPTAHREGALAGDDDGEPLAVAAENEDARGASALKRRGQKRAADKAAWQKLARKRAAREAKLDKSSQASRAGEPTRAKSEPAAASAPPAAAASAPDTPASLTREAEKLFSAGQLAAARALAEKALAQNAGYARAHRTLAVICAKLGDAGCARKGYEAYLRLAPEAADAPDVRRILGM